MGISIIVPVGADIGYQEHLPDCIRSIETQMFPGDELILVLDGHSKKPEGKQWVEHRMGEVSHSNDYQNFKLVHVPAKVGPASAWNIGVKVAGNEWCILMGSDDKLLPGCLYACREVIANKPDKHGYYNLTCETSSGEIIDLHNNAAMVSKSLWDITGGFPLEAFAAMDACFISGMLGACPQHLHQIMQGTPLYWVREWRGQWSYFNGQYHGIILDIRNWFTEKARKQWKF